MIASGALYLGLFRAIAKADNRKVNLSAIIGLGVLMRLLFFGSNAIYEDDWQRYLWDAAVVDEGISPYAYAPGEALPFDILGSPIPLSEDPSLHRLQEMAQEYPQTHRRINYPYVSTIYPPLAQIGFWVSHRIAPFNLDSWRFVLLLADTAAFITLLLALNSVGRSQLWALLYWWNPILITTTFNAGHMDVLISAPLLAAFLFAQKRRLFTSAFALSIAAGIKFWPLVLAPILFRSARKRPAILISAAAVLSLATALFISPMLLSLNPEHSGLFAYANTWLRNSFLFPLLSYCFNILTEDGDLWSRLFVAISVGTASLYFGFLAKNNADRQASALLTVIALLFFLSPTGYPWYANWLFLFLPFAPSLGIGALALTLPLYYTRYALQAAGHELLFDTAVVPIEFTIPIIILVIENARRHFANRLLRKNRVPSTPI